MLRIALIGLGEIAHAVLECLARAQAPVDVAGALVASPARDRKARVPLCGTLDALLATKPALVVEMASQQALSSAGPQVLEAGMDLLAISVGALAHPETLSRMESAARGPGAGRLYVAPGALAGIDALAAARHMGLDAVRYTRRAPPRTWIASGALSAQAAAALASPKTVFQGTARLAAQAFPKNANVAATIALAGLGFERTTVELVADPALAANVHEIHAEGDFGTLHTRISSNTLSPHSTSSRIVVGNVARAIVSRTARIAV